MLYEDYLDNRLCSSSCLWPLLMVIACGVFLLPQDPSSIARNSAFVSGPVCMTCPVSPSNSFQPSLSIRATVWKPLPYLQHIDSGSQGCPLHLPWRFHLPNTHAHLCGNCANSILCMQHHISAPHHISIIRIIQNSRGIDSTQSVRRASIS